MEDYILDLDVEHEDRAMRMFARSLEGSAKKWFYSLEKGNTSSYADFTQTFIRHWDPSCEEDQ